MQTAVNLNAIEIAVKANNLVRFNPSVIGVLDLTRTMLEKSIIDANESIRRLSKLFHVDYD